MAEDWTTVDGSPSPETLIWFLNWCRHQQAQLTWTTKTLRISWVDEGKERSVKVNGRGPVQAESLLAEAIGRVLADQSVRARRQQIRSVRLSPEV